MTPAQLDAAFAELEQAAVKGLRCFTGRSKITTALAREGRISVEVYAKNFRRVTILMGPHAGKQTASPENPNWRPYLVVGLDSRRAERPLSIAANQQRGQPSAPRPLTDEELNR